MADSDYLQGLSELTDREMEVLELRCDGLAYKRIAALLYISLSTVKTHMGNIYIKLGLEECSRSERHKILFGEICKKVNEGRIQPVVSEQSRDLVPIPQHIEDMVDEDEFALIPSQPTPIEIIPPAPQPRRIRWMLYGMLLMGMLLTSLIWVFWDRIQTVFPQPTLPPPITEIAHFEEVPVTVIVSATPLPLGPTSTAIIQEVTVEVNSTPLPPSATAEIQITPAEETTLETQTQAEVQPAGSIFSDDFEDGPDPAWQTIYGETGMANGKMTVTTPFTYGLQTEHLTVLEGYTWENVAITVELSIYNALSSSPYGAGVIILRYRENGDSVGLLIYPNRNGIQFGVLSADREWEFLTGSLVEGSGDTFDLDDRANTLRVEAVGDTFTAYINDEKVTSATVPGFTSGKVGFWFLTHKYRDDPRSYAARFEYITIESLP